MKFTKTLIALALALTVVGASAQVQPQPQFKHLSLLSGYNVLVPTNATVGLGTTNVEFTRPDGKIVYSLTNVSGGTWADAFTPVQLKSDVNGTIPANAAVFYCVGDTNLIPIAITNGYNGYMVTNWALSYPFPYTSILNGATTNLYSYLSGTVNSTNVYTISLYRRSPINTAKISAGSTATGSSTDPKPVYKAESTAVFTFTVTGNGITPVCGYTNLPSAWLQSAGGQIYATVTCGPLINAAPDGLLNQLEIVQPQN